MCIVDYRRFIFIIQLFNFPCFSLLFPSFCIRFPLVLLLSSFVPLLKSMTIVCRIKPRHFLLQVTQKSTIYHDVQQKSNTNKYKRYFTFEKIKKAHAWHKVQGRTYKSTTLHAHPLSLTHTYRWPLETVCVCVSVGGCERERVDCHNNNTPDFIHCARVFSLFCAQ